MDEKNAAKSIENLAAVLDKIAWGSKAAQGIGERMTLAVESLAQAIENLADSIRSNAD